jgi:hypothetical protein
MTNADTEQGRFMFEEWHRRTAAADLQGLLDLYAEDVTFESPLVPRLLDRESGVVTGKDDLRSFFLLARGGPPRNLARGFRTGAFQFDGRTPVWEYPRATPNCDQFDLAESMDLQDGRIVHHRVYWGWKGAPILCNRSTFPSPH